MQLSIGENKQTKKASRSLAVHVFSASFVCIPIPAQTHHLEVHFRRATKRADTLEHQKISLLGKKKKKEKEKTQSGSPPVSQNLPAAHAEKNILHFFCTHSSYCIMRRKAGIWYIPPSGLCNTVLHLQPSSQF